MARKKAWWECVEAELAAAEEADRERAEQYERQQQCLHSNAVASFDWDTGRLVELHCPDCEATRTFY